MCPPLLQFGHAIALAIVVVVVGSGAFHVREKKLIYNISWIFSE